MNIKKVNIDKIYFLVFFLMLGACNNQPEHKENSLIKFVDPFIGTGGHGHTYPGASMPFGMMQLSPDTRLDGWDGCSGYHYSDSVIFGFSHTHLSGTGIGDYCDLLLMPTMGEKCFNNGHKNSKKKNYSSKFSKENEYASTGLYQVKLEKHGIDCKLTTTQRVGIHQYTFSDTINTLSLIHI